jgi:gamma-glutamylaminecyclotransferase
MAVVFVYGTLKRGGTNHALLADQHFIGEALTAPVYQLFQLDGYPGLVRAAGAGQAIAGELWAVDDPGLARLDVLEGTDLGLYVRTPVALQPPHDGLAAETYLYAQSTVGRRDLGTRFD